MKPHTLLLWLMAAIILVVDGAVASAATVLTLSPATRSIGYPYDVSQQYDALDSTGQHLQDEDEYDVGHMYDGVTRPSSGVADALSGSSWRIAARGVGRNLDDLSRAAGAADRNGLTAAGRALRKHGDRAGSAFPRVAGSAASRNAAGQSMGDDILTNPGSTFTNGSHKVFGDVLDFRSPSGLGVRFGGDGSFIGFLEP